MAESFWENPSSTSWQLRQNLLGAIDKIPDITPPAGLAAAGPGGQAAYAVMSAPAMIKDTLSSIVRAGTHFGIQAETGIAPESRQDFALDALSVAGVAIPEASLVRGVAARTITKNLGREFLEDTAGTFGNRGAHNAKDILGNSVRDIDNSAAKLDFTPGTKSLKERLQNNPELFDLYPEIANTKVEVFPSRPDQPFKAAVLRDREVPSAVDRMIMYVDPEDTAGSANSMFHEVQHLVRGVDVDEGFVKPNMLGSNPQSGALEFQQFKKAVDVARARGVELPKDIEEAFDSLSRTNAKGALMGRKSGEDVGARVYASKPGEVEANLSGRSWRLSPEDRRSVKALDSMNVLDVDEMTTRLKGLSKARTRETVFGQR